MNWIPPHAGQGIGRLGGNTPIRPVAGIAEPLGKPIEIVDQERFAVPETLEKCSVVDDDGGNTGERLAAILRQLSLIRVSYRSQCVLKCCSHAAYVRHGDTVCQCLLTTRRTLFRAA